MGLKGVEGAYKEFAKRHHLDAYKIKKPKRKRDKRYASASFSALPKVRGYHGQPGWYGDPVNHGLAARGIRTAKYINPSRSEYALNRKPRITRAVDYGYGAVRVARQDYRNMQREAKKEGATPLPTAQRLGYNAKYVTPENLSFYATRTGRALKFVIKKASEAKARADKKRAEQAYQKAQQKALEQKMVREQKFKESHEKEVTYEPIGGIAEIAKEVQEKEKPRGAIGLFKK